jgi:regulator of sigma E protease
VVGEVQENSPAYNVGVKEGDRIKSINGNSTDSFEEIYSYVSLNPNKKLKLAILRHEQVMEIDIICGEREIKDSNNKVIAKVGILGIKSEKPKLEQLNILDSALAGVNDIIIISRMTFTALVQIFAGDRSLDEIRGTISIAEQSGSSLEGGVLSFFMYIAMISINVGFVNLLPVPILDGGHIVLCLYELVLCRRPGPKIQAILNGVGLVFIIFLFVISTSNDIKALLSR